MGWWNHRIIRTRNQLATADNLDLIYDYPEVASEYRYAVHEVYYSSDGKVVGIAETPKFGPFPNRDILVETLQMLLQTLNTPILNLDECEVDNSFWDDIEDTDPEDLISGEDLLNELRDLREGT